MGSQTSATPMEIIKVAKNAGASPEQVVAIEVALGLLSEDQGKDKMEHVNEFEKFCKAIGVHPNDQRKPTTTIR